MPLSAVRIEFVRSLFCGVQFRAAIGGLRRRHGQASGIDCRSGGYLAAVQSRHPIREIFRSPEPASVFEMVRVLGGASPPIAESRRLVLSQRRRRALESDATARNRFRTAGLVRSPKHHSLGQIDRH